jgi:hypothetical protein
MEYLMKNLKYNSGQSFDFKNIFVKQNFEKIAFWLQILLFYAHM